MQTAWTHTSVLLPEAVNALLGRQDGAMSAGAQAHGSYVDATFGRGGHARLLLSQLSATGRLLAFDQDPQAVASAQTIQDPRFSIRHQAFSALGTLPAASLAGVLLDLGVSSPQLDDPARGFSFRFDAPLDMRMDTTRGQSVAQWLAGVELQQLTQVIRDYGEERFAGSVAKALVARRQQRGPLATTTELAELVAGAVKTREPGQNPATRTFQAFRIFINAELQQLQLALDASLRVLAPGGRLVVISFHSLEDRIVKQFMSRHAREPVDRRSPAWLQRSSTPMPLCDLRRVRPGAAEVAANPRARSAVMRVAIRSDAP